ncbi:hypothetical protein O1M54_41845 [Streptomyces diastatochromogenes]|nr:hypothetical protein [Streptomyces diastatochromogenes]
MRPPRDRRPPVALEFRAAAAGRRTVYVVHPGALAAQVHWAWPTPCPRATG